MNVTYRNHLQLCRSLGTVMGLCSLLLASETGIPRPPNDSTPLFGALQAELDRSWTELRKRDVKPHFISYLYWDIKSFRVEASLGGIEFAGSDRELYLDVDLRVGTSQLDNSNFQGNLIFGPRLRLPLPMSDDSLLVRRAVWAATDGRYKVAVEELAQKKAYLANQQVQSRPPDWISIRKPRQRDFCDPYQAPDSAETVRSFALMSRLFERHPWLAESRVSFHFYYTTLYYLDSEGGRYRYGHSEYTGVAAALAQAQDGAPVWDYARSTARSLSDWDAKRFERGIANLVDRLNKTRTAQTVSSYRGPVLFQGIAASAFVNQSVIRLNQNLKVPLGMIQSQPAFWIEMMNKRLLPQGIRIHDKPGKQEHDGVYLHGYYPFDHQNSLPHASTIVENGLISDYYRGRSPVDSIRLQSNGFWRFGQEFSGVVELSAGKRQSEKRLLKHLRKLAKAEGNQFGLIVSQLQDDDALALLRHPLASLLGTSDLPAGFGTISVGAPVRISALDVKTGEVRPIRGLRFSQIDSKSLRTLVGVGKRSHRYEPQAVTTILSPDLLLGLLDLKTERNLSPKLPLLR